MTLPRGFRAQAEKEVLDLREKLGLGVSDVVDLNAAAELFGVTVIDGGELVGVEPFAELNRLQQELFGAALFEVSGRKFIVTNPGVTEARRRTDVAYQLALVKLGQLPADTRQIGGLIFRVCPPFQEEQVLAYAGILLLPRDTMLSSAGRFVTSFDEIDPVRLARRQKVTAEMARFRLANSGYLSNNKRVNASFADRHKLPIELR